MQPEAGGARRIHCGGTDRILQAPVSKFSHVSDRAVHGQDAAGKFSIHRAPAVFDLNLDGAKLIGAIRHAGGGRRVGNKNALFDSFGP